jgi:hypothetical protein
MALCIATTSWEYFSFVIFLELTKTCRTKDFKNAQMLIYEETELRIIVVDETNSNLCWCRLVINYDVLRCSALQNDSHQIICLKTLFISSGISNRCRLQPTRAGQCSNH